MTGARLVGFVLAGLVLAGCYTGPSADHFVAVLDELPVPDTWQLAKETVRGPDKDSCNPGVTVDCPIAKRHYIVEADLWGAYDEAKLLLTGTGFAITDESTSGCASGSGNGPPCGFFADRGSDQVHVGIYASPEQAGLDPPQPSGVVVVVRASRS